MAIFTHFQHFQANLRVRLVSPLRVRRCVHMSVCVCGGGGGGGGSGVTTLVQLIIYQIVSHTLKKCELS